MPDTGAVGGCGHRGGLGVVHGDGFLAKDVFAGDNGGVGDGCVNKIRRGDDDGVNIVAADDFLVAGGGGGDAGLLPGAFERGGIRVAERDDLGVRAKGESGEMVLQRDAAATDDGEVELLHLSGQNLMSGEYVGPRGKGKPVAV